MDGKKLEYKGDEALKEVEMLSEKADEIQEGLLKEMLVRNKETEYLSKYMAGSEDVSEFKRRVPVITYKHIHPYIQRIANGESSSLITAHPITEMFISSGTSAGEPKMIPSIAEDLDRRTFLYNLIMPIINQYMEGLAEGKAMFLYFVKAEKWTPCGMPFRTVLTSYYKSQHFKRRAPDPYNDYTSPLQVILCNDGKQSMYCQLLAGLVHRRHVLRLGAVFASAFLLAISFLEQNWASLCNDIRTGQLSSAVTDPECRSAMAALLSSPDPGAAEEIEATCGRPSWEGIICELWPRAKYIEAVVTGSMAQYIPALEHYTGGKVPLVCTMYAASESYFGVNLKPFCPPAKVVFTLLPNMCYFEFMPLAVGDNGKLLLDRDGREEVAGDELVDLVRVQLGCYYELVVTTFSGLYRYRVGDVLQVSGFHNRAPQFRFICRRNVVLSVDNDNTNEEDLHKSIAKAKKLLEGEDAMLVEYSSYADTSSFPGHYVLFWEIKMKKAGLPAAKLFQECCICVEEELDCNYKRCRSNDRSVGALEIRVVKPRTFEALMELLIAQGASINQYKTPRCIKSPAAFRLLNSNVMASFFSPRDPTWNP